MGNGRFSWEERAAGSADTWPHGGFHKWMYLNHWMVYFMENPSINA